MGEISLDREEDSVRSSGFALTVRFTLRDASAAQQFDDLLAQTIGGIRAELGTLAYVVHTPVKEPLVRVFYELYVDRGAFETHEQQEHTKRFLAAREPLLSNVEVAFLDEMGTLSKRPGAGQA
ncbi:putative quinol monooxygenase [Streptomyces sp. NPDC001822]|uniref:putative quinol monooxygenase n=1 Tax=Streptomyces sp. NPDC001822 TaxID=3364614 RepID=UPI0036CF2341